MGALVIRWVEPKPWNGDDPASSRKVHLDRFADEAAREGWQVTRRYDGPQPLIHVYDREIQDFGESITLAPGRTADMWWFRSSTGENLAPHTKPAQAAKQVTRILIPYVTAVRAARSHQTQTPRPPSPTPPAVPDPSHQTTIAGLHERFAGVVCWWGTYTYEWWAIVPGGTQWKIVNAEDPETLLHKILKARNP
ncbi:hypothetical protein ACFOY4_35740 [Actinomadura syzygii]|uniref:Uncharacterized protein n=1 Tax=Actinomadura syzygii TaxID=1427538 RepID=A0A5D0TVI3_9ACTN|nr:hypothetical protein [Actinomadura syzygii]TYC08879.1 hypothetical protein FXF65_35690 [Actinomadura syzygii]